ncbi:Gfo/Idh/MocA family oxidoreductase [Bacillus sp. OTU530]|uniref:Gfo/Idh/MocA family oxidoreductase n=1 Tax=Bacillus sp. OTU530 TaxID=3043862 RepID=UPI00313D977B
MVCKAGLEKGSIAFPSFRVYSYDDEIYGWDHELKFEKLTVEDNDPMTAELEHFISVLRGEARTLVTGEDALETLKVIKAIKESVKAGQKINMNDSTLIV